MTWWSSGYGGKRASLVVPTVKNPQTRRPGFNPRVGKISQRRKWLPTPVFLPGDFHGRRRNLADYSPWTCKESDTTEQLTTGLPRWLSGEESACNGDLGLYLAREDSLEEGMATRSSILAWRIPWTEEPGGLHPIGSRRVGHD